ncbi:hypothetical protein RUND412_002726 [Rhizina undulata]
MPSYVISGASRGIGFGFVEQLSTQSENIVFALVRNVKTSDKLNELANLRANIHVLQADITDHVALKVAAAQTSRITGGCLDVLINNAGLVSDPTNSKSLTDYDGREDVLEKEFQLSFNTNVIGVIHTTNAFLPLLKKGSLKKVVSLSTGLADISLVKETKLYEGAPYAASKIAMNMVVAKYAEQFRDEGFTFLAMSPGLVDTSTRAPTEQDIENLKKLSAALKVYKPDFKGAITVDESVRLQLEVIEKAAVADTGNFVSQFGNQVWI